MYNSYCVSYAASDLITLLWHRSSFLSLSLSIERAGKKFLMNSGRNKLSVASSLFRYSVGIRESFVADLILVTFIRFYLCRNQRLYVSQLYTYSEISHNQPPHFPLHLYSLFLSLSLFLYGVLIILAFVLYCENFFTEFKQASELWKTAFRSL